MDDATSIKSYRKIMEEFDQYLRSQLTGCYIKKGINDHSLQFRYSNVGVDLLISPYFASKQEYYNFLEIINKENIPLYVVLPVSDGLYPVIYLTGSAVQLPNGKWSLYKAILT